MIAKIVGRRTSRVRSSFGRLVDYLTHSKDLEHRVESVKISNCYSRDVYGVVQEVEVTQSLNSRMRSDPVEHVVVSFPDDDREKLTEAMFARIEAEICEVLGYEGHQRLRVLHNDTDSLHFHIAINRIHPETHRAVDVHRSKEVLGDMCERLEAELGLKRTRHRRREGSAKKGRYRDFEAKTGRQSLTKWMQDVCLDGLLAARDWSEFQRVLDSHGLTLRERGRGFVFLSGDGASAKPSDVSRDLSRSKLEARFGGPFIKLRSKGKGQTPVRDRYTSQPEVVTTYSRTYWRAFVASRSPIKKYRSMRRFSLGEQIRRRAVKRYISREARMMIRLYRAARRLRANVRRGGSTRSARSGVLNTEREVPHGSYLDYVRQAARRGAEGAVEELRARSHYSPSSPRIFARVNSDSLQSTRYLKDVTRNGVRVFVCTGIVVKEYRGQVWCPAGVDREFSNAVDAIAAEFGVRYGKFWRNKNEQNNKRGSGSGHARFDHARARGNPGSAKKGASASPEASPDAPAPKTRGRLRVLSEIPVVRERKQSELLLSSNVRGDVGQQQPKRNEGMRRRGGGGGLGSSPSRQSRGRLSNIEEIGMNPKSEAESFGLRPPPSSRGRLRTLDDVKVQADPSNDAKSPNRGADGSSELEAGYCRPVVAHELEWMRRQGLGPLFPPKIRRMDKRKRRYALHSLHPCDSGIGDYFAFLRRGDDVYVVRVHFSSEDDARAAVHRRYVTVDGLGRISAAKSKGMAN